MSNTMAEEMTRRYADYLDGGPVEERGAKAIYYWVMSSLESFFWGVHVLSFEADLYATGKRMYLVLREPGGREYTYDHYPTYNCDDEKLPIMLQKFITIFNDIKYPLSEKISSPIFRAYDSGVMFNSSFRSQYNGYHHVVITVDMLPDADDDPANHGSHA